MRNLTAILVLALAACHDDVIELSPADGQPIDARVAPLPVDDAGLEPGDASPDATSAEADGG